MSGVADVRRHPVLAEMVERLKTGLGGRLESVVLYGSAARGEFREKTSDFNLIVVLEDLEPATLEALAPIAAWWRRRGHHVPRLFSPGFIAKSADVFPIEFLEIRGSRLVLHGEDPFAALEIAREPLRLQCERELKEKLMRLREGYLEGHESRRALGRLLASSYPAFAAIFRGCLHLWGGDAPVSSGEVVSAFCARAGLSRSAFEAVERLRRGERPDGDLKAVFALYYEELSKAARAVDRLRDPQGGGGR
jgi:predicted nucleotidyltransferase